VRWSCGTDYDRLVARDSGLYGGARWWQNRQVTAEQEDLDLIGSIEHTPIATVITNPRLPDNPIVAANRAFSELTGYPAEEIIGRNCRFLAGPATEQIGSQALRDAIQHARPVLTELLNYRRDGSSFRNAVMIAPVFGAAGELLYFIGSQMEVAAGAGPLSAVRRQESAEKIRRLSPRQRQVLREVMLGYRNKQIAPRLGISEKTVKMHRASMLAKLEVGTSADAVRIAVEAGL
jgi:PAS domain S-box-containing protein